MKKLTLSVLALAAISFASCKKDYTCVCKYKSSNIEASRTTIKDTQDNAKSTCTALSSNVTDCTIQ
ncbi:MAG: hypothetical protein C0448_08060 [Sphingobacteriaceae bacterium]|nr:hypothetical protein [Sphingobacteriaceae bacterium]